jgi:cytochrome c oxidase subunit II
MSSNNYRRENYHAWTWGIAALLLLALLWLWITGRGPGAGAACCGAPVAVSTAPVVSAPVAPATVTPVAPPAAAPTAAAPETSAMAKPVATLYFETGKTTAPADAAALIAPVVAYLQKNTQAKAVVSGYNDSRGNAAMNAELSKNRAKAAREALKAAGVDEARIELRKPQDTNLSGDLKEARRVEISVEP